LAAGRLFDKGEDKLSMRVAVLGEKVVRALFRRKDPVGETFRMNGIPFRVVGTLMPKGMSYDGVNLDDEILIPLNTAMQRVFNLNYIGYIYVEVTKKEDMQAVEREIRNILRERHDLNVLHEKDDFTIQDIYTSVSAANETRASFSSMVAAVAALSLLVGGMGVLAVMLLSIKERRSEIGLRMAVGAKSGDVLFQFMAEALVLSMTGGFIGILLGVGGVWFMKSFAAINVIISAWSVTVAVAESAMIGVLFGSWPARKASLVLPAKTLRE
jgi:ABC-type antimicrobial peptide transport system permease subunit